MITARPSRGQVLRAKLLLLLLGLAYVPLAGRLFDLMVRDHERYASLAALQQRRVRAVKPLRGDVLAADDRHVVVVAASVPRGSLLVEGRPERPARTPARRGTLTRDVPLFMERLGRAIDLAPEEVASVRERLARGASFIFRRRKLGAEEVERLRSASLEGAAVIPEPVRAYPFGRLGAHVLGLLDADGEGTSGVERTFDRMLRGTEGLREIELDRRMREIAPPSGLSVADRPGLSLVLTIDRRVQEIVERELDRTCEDWRPRGVACVVLDPGTGFVLAMGSRPAFDPASPGGAPADAFRNRVLSDTYEPGSTIKPLIVGSAWDQGLGAPERSLSCPRRWHLPGRRKAIEDVHEVGDTDEAGALVSSSNVGATKIADRLGLARIRSALLGFGLGRRAEIELEAEAQGDLSSLSRRDPTTLGSVAQGYALTVTPLQMALAYGAIANGGTLYRPRVVRELRDASGTTVKTFEPLAVARSIGARTARAQLGPALERVVSDPRGTARSARIRGYTLAGKTGTTKKIVDGRYDEREAIVSFCGFAPHDDPRIAIAVVVFEPTTEKGRVWGGTIAAPAAGRIAERALAAMGVAAR